jgi:hypothetical protein
MRTLRSICVVTITLLATFTALGDVRRASTNVVQQPTVSLSSTQLGWFYEPPICPVIWPKNPETVVLTNKGPGVLDITNISGANGVSFSQTNNCGNTLGVGQSCSITVTWHPKGNTVYGSLLITDSGVASPQSVSLKGIWSCLR